MDTSSPVTIFAEVSSGKDKIIVGEIYRVPNTNEKLSIQSYENILQKLAHFNGDVIIGTDENFNYLDIERHGNTQDLLNLFITSGFIPTITKATRICHSTATLIDNIYTKLKCNEDIISGILSVDISDHLPVFMIMGQPITTKRTPKVITYIPMDNSKITAMANYLDNYNWDSMT